MRFGSAIVKALCLVVGIGALAAPVSAQEAAVQQQEYILGPGDVVEVNVPGREDFKTRTRIRQDGTIVLPFLGEVRAADRTTAEFGEFVRGALRAGGYFANPVVSVDIVSYASRYVTVLGLVGTPGLVPVDRPYRLSEILARVGGSKEDAADYVVLTGLNGQERRFNIEALATGGPNEDPFVSPGDKIYIPRAEQFFIYGQVKSPGAYPIMSEPTLRKALASGGGVTATGSHRRIRVYRNGQQVQGVGLTEAIQPGDVIVVGERLF